MTVYTCEALEKSIYQFEDCLDMELYNEVCISSWLWNTCVFLD